MCNGKCSCKNKEERKNTVIGKVVFLLRGLPGAGKSSLAKYLSVTDESICEADKYMINQEKKYEFNPNNLQKCHELCMNKFINLVNNEFYNIVVSNTFTEEWEFKKYKKYAEERGYLVFSIIVENRHGNISIHDVPEKTLATMRHRFDICL